MRKCPDSPWANKSKQTDKPNLYIDEFLNYTRQIQLRTMKNCIIGYWATLLRFWITGSGSNRV